mmetsp:Transcript_11423/g.42320  ORF Transcript_11423/g.42320 Transcript_11423/m.42320 type:complete len:408 (+) Transcript_11423:67-1290(+)
MYLFVLRKQPTVRSLSFRLVAHFRPRLGTFWSFKSNMVSRACMLTRVWDTSLGSVPSDRSACIGPCNSLFTIPRDSSSTAFICFFVNPSPSLSIAFSSSAARIISALFRSRLIVGTVSRESRHASNCACSCVNSSRASSAARSRLSLFSSTSSFKSSTLYKIVFSSSPQSASTLRGTAMSTKRRDPPTDAFAGAMFARSAFVMITPVLAAVKITSCFSACARKSSISASLMFASGKSAMSSSTRPALRLTMVISVHRFDTRCFTRSLDMVPAPTIITRHPSKLPPGSFICTSSAAALLTETAPLAIEVSERTRLPAVMAALNSPDKCRPNPSTFSPNAKTFLTCARICPSPITTESRPPLTFKRCDVASWSRNKNMCGLSSSNGTPLYLLIHSSTSRTPLCHESATT